MAKHAEKPAAVCPEGKLPQRRTGPVMCTTCNNSSGLAEGTAYFIRLTVIEDIRNTVNPNAVILGLISRKQPRIMQISNPSPNVVKDSQNISVSGQ